MSVTSSPVAPSLDGADIRELLRVRASDSGADQALVELVHGELRALTWADLARRTDSAAAALTRSGVGAEQAVVILMATGASELEIDLAVRVAGAVPVHLPTDVEPADAAVLLRDLRVRVVVVDAVERLDQLRGVDLGAAELLDLSVNEWDDLVRAGESHVETGPAIDQGPRSTESVAQLPWAEADDLLLVAAIDDPWGEHIRARHLREGGTLTWTDDVALLSPLMAAVRPQVLAVAGELQAAFTEAAAVAISPHLGNKDPLEALRSLAVPSEGWRTGRSARRVAQAVETLHPWWGGRLVTLEWDGEPDAAVIGLCRGLDIELRTVLPTGRPFGHSPHDPRAIAVASLPLRSPTDPHESFDLQAAEAAPEPTSELAPEPEPAPQPTPDLPSALVAPPLLSGESFLDQLLRNTPQGPTGT